MAAKPEADAMDLIKDAAEDGQTSSVVLVGQTGQGTVTSARPGAAAEAAWQERQ